MILTNTSQRDEPPKKMSKLAIAAETEEDKYETKSEVRCYACEVEDIDRDSGKVYRQKVLHWHPANPELRSYWK
jgi:hypothetical protein